LEHKATDESALKIIRGELSSVSASDEQFLGQLKGPIYDENVAVTRYVLIALAKGKTVEAIKTSDLWAQASSGEKKSAYVWTIEHILPQGANLPDEWIQMLGGKDEASRIQREYVHTLGNLTISGYNSTLGNKSFIEKRDRTDNSKNFVGYKNGLSLNEDLAKKDSWGEQAIMERTENLNAIYLPYKTKNTTKLIKDLTPVNTFRFIFNEFFNDTLPYKKNEVFYSDYYNLFRFTKIKY
jgi:hypothetical protein